MEAIRQDLKRRLAEILRINEKVGSHLRHTDNALSVDSEEQATERAGDEVLEALDASTRAEAVAIRAALTRIDEGVYGICTSCGERIGEARLQALPFAERCVECAD